MRPLSSRITDSLLQPAAQNSPYNPRPWWKVRAARVAVVLVFCLVAATLLLPVMHAPEHRRAVIDGSLERATERQLLLDAMPRTLTTKQLSGIERQMTACVIRQARSMHRPGFGLPARDLVANDLERAEAECFEAGIEFLAATDPGNLPQVYAMAQTVGYAGAHNNSEDEA